MKLDNLLPIGSEIQEHQSSNLYIVSNIDIAISKNDTAITYTLVNPLNNEIFHILDSDVIQNIDFCYKPEYYFIR